MDGIPLTVTEVDLDGLDFEVCLIPHTWDVTTLKNLEPGSRVNIEIDILARYMARWLGQRDRMTDIPEAFSHTSARA